MRKKVNDIANNPDRLNAIMEGAKITGDMITASNIRIDGEIIGNISCPAKIVIGEKGHVHGDIECRDADIEGTVVGTISVDNLLSLKATSVITAEIKTGKLHVEEGATFDGTCSMTKEKPPVGNSSKQEGIVY